MLARIFAFLCMLIAPANAQLAFIQPTQPQLPIVAINCTTQTATGGGSFASMFSGTRSTAELAQWSDGHWSSFGAGTVAATDLGCQFQHNATNSALWSRDLTNAAWTKVTMTTALTGTGIDNTANSATLLTATGANATVEQAITLASGTDTVSAFLRGVTVTGAVSITLNGGTTWTACQVSTSAAIGTQRCSVTTASVTNPTIGIQIANSGDSVIVDGFQLEQTGQLTAPIFTTTAAVPRSNDVWAPAGSLLTALEGSYVTLCMPYTLPIATNAAPFRQYLFVQSDTGNARLNFRAADVAGQTEPQLVVGDGTANSTITDVNQSANAFINTCATWSTQVASAAAMSMIGRTSVTSSRVFGGVVTSASVIGECVCVIQSINVYNAGLSSAQLPPITEVPTSNTSTPVSVTAQQADSLVNSIGVNTHLTFTSSVYWTNFTAFTTTITGIGIRHYRDGMNLLTTDPNYSTALTRYGTMCGDVTDIEMPIPTLHYATIAAALSQDTGIYTALTTCLSAWEGTNEADAIVGNIYMSLPWVQGAIDWQNDLYSNYHGNSNVGSLPIIQTSVTNSGNSSAYQTWCANTTCPQTNADHGNLHPYSGSTYPSFNLAANITNGELPASTAGNIWATEWGYFTAGPAIGTFYPVSENAQAKYIERGVLEMYNAGLARAYIYELMDEAQDSGNTNAQDHFGLVHYDGTAKAAYTTLVNLINLLKDPGAPFTPGSILIGPYLGNPSLHSQVFENRNGHYFACYWLEVLSYNTSTQQDIPVQPVANTLTLGNSWTTAKVWEPYTSSSPIATYSSPTTVPLQVADDVQCVELIP